MCQFANANTIRLEHIMQNLSQFAAKPLLGNTAKIETTRSPNWTCVNGNRTLTKSAVSTLTSHGAIRASNPWHIESNKTLCQNPSSPYTNAAVLTQIILLTTVYQITSIHSARVQHIRLHIARFPQTPGSSVQQYWEKLIATPIYKLLRVSRYTIYET